MYPRKKKILTFRIELYSFYESAFNLNYSTYLNYYKPILLD